jgi:membrane protease YdiL (CAAX protease family)
VTARGLWARLAASTLVGTALVLWVSPAHPVHRMPAPVAPLVGAAAGALLFLAVTRQAPRVSPRRVRLRVSLAEQALLGLWAANEEIVWRRVALGELLPAGVLVALALSTVGFAVVHRRRRVLHLGTGAAFAGVYVATGWLGASVAAHWLYNFLVGTRVDRLRPPAGLPA